MRGTIEKIEEKKIKTGKNIGNPYHLLEIEGDTYWVWDAELIKGISKGLVEFESDGDKYPKITSISMCTGGELPPPKQASRYDDTKVWNTCVMCAKDIVVVMIPTFPDMWKRQGLDAIKATTIDIALSLYKASENGVVEENVTPEEEPPTEPDQSLFDSFNYQIINTKWANKEGLAAWWTARGKDMLKMTEDERKQLIKVYSEELGKIK